MDNNLEIKEILKEQLELIKPKEREIKILKNFSKLVIRNIDSSIKTKKIKAEIIIAGSLAKNTIIRKDKYDTDLFVRFSPDYEDKKISDILEKILKRGIKSIERKKLKNEEENKIKKISMKRIHGSRDYFQLTLKTEEKGKLGKILFEIIPVIKITKPEEARNITDLSVSHVSYIKKRIKEKPRLADEIRLAKAFCYAQNCYGAESYIRGFSGYSLELLICYYKGFLKFIRKIASLAFEERLVIDMEKLYKNRQDVLLNMNEAKLRSPIVFVDPVCKNRNVLAALSQETFTRFKSASMAFLKNPVSDFFKKKKIDGKEMQKQAKKKKAVFLSLLAKTNKQEGDIAGSKLLKFFRFISSQIEKDFIIVRKEFQYNEKKAARFYFILKMKKEIIIKGPKITNIEHVTRFKNVHKSVFIKQDTVYAREKTKTIRNLINEIKTRNKAVMRDMGIVELC